MPQSLTGIDGNAFLNCGKLAEIAFPPHLQYIGTCAFKNCKELSSISLSGTIGFIDSDIFSGCTSLKRLYIPQNFQFHSSQFVFGRYRLMDVPDGRHPMRIQYAFAYNYLNRSYSAVNLDQHDTGDGRYVFHDFDSRKIFSMMQNNYPVDRRYRKTRKILNW